ncbi:Acid phosphatase 1-like protein [Drosera capensis]
MVKGMGWIWRGRRGRRRPMREGLRLGAMDWMFGFSMSMRRCCRISRIILSMVMGVFMDICSLTVFDAVAFDKWVDKAGAPAIEASLKLYEEVLSLGIKVFLLTGRNEQQRNVTVQNLLDVGFKNWEKLILRSSDDHGKPATVYKSQKRNELVNDGYRIIGNSGDQWSDLLGYAMSVRSFKLPNPMYYIA